MPTLAGMSLTHSRTKEGHTLLFPREALSASVPIIALMAVLVSVAQAFGEPPLRVPSATASSRTIQWGGSGANDLGPASILLSVRNARVRLVNVQAVMSCTDRASGTQSDGAFDASRDTQATLNRNRYTLNFTEHSGGRTGHVQLSGTLGSNGRGTAWLRLTASGVDSATGATIEDCAATVHFRLRRG
jgi:hypothetical protein